MKLEDQVVSLDLARKMKELGFPQDSLFDWQRSWHDEPYRLNPGGVFETVDKDAIISAYTVAELGEILPWDFIDGFERGRLVIEKSPIPPQWGVGYVSDMGGRMNQKNDKLSDAMALLCIYLKNRGYYY